MRSPAVLASQCHHTTDQFKVAWDDGAWYPLQLHLISELPPDLWNLGAGYSDEEVIERWGGCAALAAIPERPSATRTSHTSPSPRCRWLVYRWIEPRMPAALPTDSKDDLKEALVAALETEVEARFEPLVAAIERARKANASHELTQVMYKTPAKGPQSLYGLALKEFRRLTEVKKDQRTPRPAPWETGKKYQPARRDQPKRQSGGEGASDEASASPATVGAKRPRRGAPAAD